MREILIPDICVIGAGSGGLTVAAAAAAFGVPVVLIEKAKMGGDCLNTGCVPSKSLIAAAKHAHAIARAKILRRCRCAASMSISRVVHKHVHGVIAAIEPNDFEGTLQRAGRARHRGRRRAFGMHRPWALRRGRRGDRGQGAALRYCNRLLALAAAHRRPCGDAASTNENDIRAHHATRASHCHRRGPGGARACARPSGAWAARSRCSKPASRLHARIRNARGSCSMRSRARAWSCAPARRSFASRRRTGT